MLKRLMGIETEYGLSVSDKGAADQVMEAMGVVRAFPSPAWVGWDYRPENPRRDMRGFSVAHLQMDPEDAKFEAERPTRLPDSEVKSDHALRNGARLYNDHGHPEYATPECLSIADLVAHDKAGEEIVRLCAGRYAARNECEVTIYKNNTDFHGASYGTHENYLVRRDVPFESLQRGIMPFFVTRILYAGAGKVGAESDGARATYQLSQRADFFVEEANVETLFRRPILNTRDEPHANETEWRRLHVICGDANMNEYAIALKVGTTALALALIEDGWQPQHQIAEPVKAIKAISRSDDHRWLIIRDDGATIPAVEIQREYLREADKRFRGADAQWDWTLTEWRETLDALEKHPAELADRVDWVAKRGLIDAYLQAEGLDWSSPMAQSVDLEYHNIEPSQGLYHALQSEGRAHRVVSDEHIDHAMNEPPADTRAYIRHLCVARFRERIESVSWGGVNATDQGKPLRIDLSRMVGDVRDLNRTLAEAGSVAELIELVQRGTS